MKAQRFTNWFYVIYLILFTFILAKAAFGSDALHVPILVKYHQESHAVAGALTGLGVDYVLEHSTRMNRPLRFVVSVASALALGAVKEYCIDKHPNNKEIGPWGLGAAAALTISFSVRF